MSPSIDLIIFAISAIPRLINCSLKCQATQSIIRGGDVRSLRFCGFRLFSCVFAFFLNLFGRFVCDFAISIVACSLRSLPISGAIFRFLAI